MPDDSPTLLRYVVLHHEGIDIPHFDLMLERSAGSDLETFRIPVWPITATTPLVPLGDHRRAYLDYQGPISNNRGHVSRVETGLYSRDVHGDTAQQLMLYPHPDRGARRALTLHCTGNDWTAHPIVLTD